MKRIYRVFWSIVLLIAIAPPLPAQIVLKNTRELFVDDYLIDRLVQVIAKPGEPVSCGPALKLDRPWEGKFSGAYVSVLFDGSRYRMYYRGTGLAKEVDKNVTCYAESDDGIHWNKPALNLYHVSGHPGNNIVLPGDPLLATHNLSVMYDNRPGVPAGERFKAVGGVASSPKRAVRGLYRYVSADGIHWRIKDSVPLFKDGYGMDSQNVLAWIPSENQYAIYLRTWTEDKPGDAKLLKGVRTIARSVSKDFIHWSQPQRMQFGNTPLEDLYTNATLPYFRTPQLLIAMPFRFSPHASVLSEAEMLRYSIDKSMWNGVSDAVLMTSRGGNVYDRKFMQSFVRPGLDDRNWAARSNIPAVGIIPTGEKEISFFLTRAYGTPDCYLERMTLRTDGFASLHADYPEGYAITKLLQLKGEKLTLNFSTSSIGYVKLILLDETGKELPGYGAADALVLRGDRIDGEVRWKSGKSLADVGTRPVKMKWVIRDADIYSFEVR
ncbi:MAG: hypothetical protein J7599_19560 [Niabella sp.]|nr:hypothetical protein [Niabella sp.]